jgi:hypothetical protein
LKCGNSKACFAFLLTREDAISSPWLELSQKKPPGTVACGRIGVYILCYGIRRQSDHRAELEHARKDRKMKQLLRTWPLSLGVSLMLLLPGAQAEPVHAIAMHGEPALPAGFTHLPYVNPDAPKGGKVTYGVVGTFDSVRPFIVKSMRTTARGLADPSSATSSTKR